LASGYARKLLSLIFVAAGVVAAQVPPPPPGFVPVIPTRTTQQRAPSRKDIPTIAKAANGAIVTIITAANDKPIAQGTGFLISLDGVIVTNYHVIKEGNKAIVKFSDGTVLPVDGVLAADKVRDLAVIKIHGKTFRTLTLGNSDRVQVGEEVVAIGNPLGLELTVSNGIVSGLRTDKEAGGKFLQITAPISPGSSGGPLFNMLGEVIGINTMYLEGGENLNFAIPINDAKLLLSNQSATLQSLPNEAEEAPTEVSKTREDPASQQTCNKQAEQFASYKRKAYSHVTYPFKSGYTNHYDAEKSRCYVEVVLDYGAGKNPLSTMPSAWLEGRLYFIYDASVEGDGSPEYGKFHQEEDGESCGIQPSGRAKINCRSEEEFNELALKYFGITQPTATISVLPSGSTNATATQVIPTTTPSNPLPPNTKMSAIPAHGEATQEQLWEDFKYCYKNPSNKLKLADGQIGDCEEVNAILEAREKTCKSKGPKNNPENCKSFLKTMKDLKAGRL
jgi:S1-C subfamily serine protease